MGITAGAVALPRHRIGEKQLRSAGIARGYESLRVPWWDEDALTLAVDAALALGDEIDRARRVVVALDEPHPQSSLVQHALGLHVPMVEVTGRLAGYDALESIKHRSTLLLAGGVGSGASGGAAGAAMMLDADQGIPLQAAANVTAGPLGGSEGAALQRAVDELPETGSLHLPTGIPGRRALASEAETPRALSIGDAGAAGLLVELLDALGEGTGPRRIAGAERGRAVALLTGEGTIDVREPEQSSTDIDVDRWRGLTEADPAPWSEASQGAYVSREEYDARPTERYGARQMGEGNVLAVTTIEAGPPGEFVRQHEASGPYDVVIVETDDGNRRIVQSAAEPGALSIGDRVRPVLRRLFSMEDQWRYAVKVVEA